MAVLVLQSGSDHLQWIGDRRRAHFADHREAEDVVERYVRVAFEVVFLSVVGLERLVDRKLNCTVRYVQHTGHEAFVEA